MQTLLDLIHSLGMDYTPSLYPGAEECDVVDEGIDTEADVTDDGIDA